MAVTAYVGWPLATFVAAYLCVYGTNSITGGNMQTLGSDIAPATARGRFYGVWQTLGSVGGPVSTSTFAVLSSVGGYWTAFTFLTATAVGAAFIVATQVHDRLREKTVVVTAEPVSGGGP